jgi:AraC-like DNA-binding protein
MERNAFEAGAISPLVLAGKRGYYLNLLARRDRLREKLPMAGLWVGHSEKGDIRVVPVEPKSSGTGPIHLSRSDPCEARATPWDAEEVRDPVVRALGAALWPALEASRGNRSELVEYLLCAFYARISERSDHIRKDATSYRERLTAWQERGAKELLAAHVEQGIRIADVAARCKLSRSHFTRAFKRSTGHTPQRWLLLHRIERAKDMLRTDRAIAEIAADCGFSDQSHFTRAFARAVGMPPGAYRRATER